MPHNESQSERKLETESKQEESIKPSKFDRVKSAAVTAGIFVIPLAVTVGATAVGYKTSKMSFDTAKLNLETAQLANAVQKAIQS
jgi:hypothetical protein